MTPYASGVAHEKMFDDDDPFLAKVRELALALPSADEKISHGRPVFFTKKLFACFGGSLKVDGEWVQHPQSLLVQPDPDDAESLTQDPRCYVPAYWGPSGWVGLDLDDDTDWGEVAELLDASFRRTATKKLTAQLDADV